MKRKTHELPQTGHQTRDKRIVAKSTKGLSRAMQSLSPTPSEPVRILLSWMQSYSVYGEAGLPKAAALRHARAVVDAFHLGKYLQILLPGYYEDIKNHVYITSSATPLTVKWLAAVTKRLEEAVAATGRESRQKAARRKQPDASAVLAAWITHFELPLRYQEIPEQALDKIEAHARWYSRLCRSGLDKTEEWRWMNTWLVSRRAQSLREGLPDLAWLDDLTSLCRSQCTNPLKPGKGTIRKQRAGLNP